MPNNVRLKLRHLLLTCLVLFGSSSCVARSQSELRTFLIRRPVAELPQLSAQLADAIAHELAQTDGLEAGYPGLGQSRLEPDPENANANLEFCRPLSTEAASSADCLLLSEAGDFVRLQPVDYLSAAFHMYRVYASPRVFLPSINPSRDYVALDVFVWQDAKLWEAVDQAILRAVSGLGGRPYQP